MIVLYLKKTNSEKVKTIFCYIVSALLLLQEISFNIWNIYVGRWSIGHTLPFHLCGMAIILSPIMLLKKNYLLYEIIYFWGFGGAVQALITPNTSFGFPHYRFFQYFLSHGLIIIGCVYMTFIYGFRPRLKSIWKTFILTNIYLVFIAIFNLLVNGNYLFICQKPETPSLIDYLGPWPWYILGLEVVAIISFFIYYLPFLIKDIIIKYKENK